MTPPVEDTEETPYKIFCPRCGEVPLSEEEYERQMRAHDRAWQCPSCRMLPVQFIEDFADSEDIMPVVARTDAGVGQVQVNIPMEVFHSHEERALANHSQTLNQLAERGGLSVGEAACILEDKEWGALEDGPDAWAVIFEHTIDVLGGSDEQV